MKLRNILLGGALLVLPLAASAATIVVPAAGSAQGANNSVWQSDVTLHSLAPRPLTVSIEFHQGTTVHTAAPLTLEAKETVLLSDIARTLFNVSEGTGALVFNVEDRDVKHLAISSATYNLQPQGRLGQEIPAVNTIDAAVPGDIVTLTGPNDAAHRFNFGVYAVTASRVRWDLVRADGTVAGSTELAYAAGQHVQYNSGVGVLFAAAGQQGLDSVHARVLEGSAVFYGSAVHPGGDPTYVPALRAREDILIDFLGVDLDENGTVDLFDADDDGVLDATMEVHASMFPSYFRIVAVGEFGETVQYEVVSSPSDATLIDADGTILLGTPGSLKGSSGMIVVRATAGDTTSTLQIPVRYR
jgi:hypothetical protein